MELHIFALSYSHPKTGHIEDENKSPWKKYYFDLVIGSDNSKICTLIIFHCRGVIEP